MKYKCKCCNKEFDIAKGLVTDYFYRRKKDFYCSYTCYKQGPAIESSKAKEPEKEKDLVIN